MKNILLALFVTLFFIGCNGNQPVPKNNIIKKTENEKLNIEKEQPKEEYEKTISYQDIIMKINDINTNKKTNKRVKNIVKEYQYKVSDDDSKNSARKKALTQVKILILEEIGVFVESYLELSTVVENEKYQKYFKEEIKNLTAGIIKTKIIDEKFDGKSYYVKASVLVDPDSVSEGISEILKIKANKSEITKLTKLLKSKEQEIDMRSSETISLQKKIANQELLNSAKQEEVKSIEFKLQQAQQQLKKFQKDEIALNSELGKIEIQVNQVLKRINNQNEKVCLMKKGMTKKEVLKIIGKPIGSESYPYKSNCNNDLMNEECSSWYYGTNWLSFEVNGLIRHVLGCE